MYCPQCGSKISSKAKQCAKCGTDVRKYTGVNHPHAAATAAAAPMKRKPLTLAGGLLLGGWVWLYTYKKDLWKFIFFVVGEVAAAVAIIYGLVMASIDKSWGSWLGFFGLVFVLLLAFEILIRVWILMEAAKREEAFYLENEIFSKGGKDEKN